MTSLCLTIDGDALIALERLALIRGATIDAVIGDLLALGEWFEGVRSAGDCLAIRRDDGFHEVEWR
jgi:hypothetical protein